MNYYNRRVKGIATAAVVAVIAVLIVIAGIGYGLYASQKASTSTTSITTTSTTTVTDTQTGSSSNTTSSVNAVVTELAYAHWASIASGNLSATVSEYSSNATLSWNISPSGANNGTYTGTTNITSLWTTFFSSNPTSYYNIENFSIVVTNSTFVNVTATLWFVLGSGNSSNTLQLPYELGYSYQNGTWLLVSESWGLSTSPGILMAGVVSPPVSVSTTSTMTSSTTGSTSTSMSSSTSTTTTSSVTNSTSA